MALVYWFMDEVLADLKVFFDVEDADEELTSVQFFRLIKMLPSYSGATRTAIEAWSREHEEELKNMQEANKPPIAPITLSAEGLKTNPKLSAAPAAGQLAPLFDVKQVS